MKGVCAGDLLAVTSNDIADYKDHFLVEHKPASINVSIAALHSFYKWLDGEGSVGPPGTYSS
jgi:hypothetical protein